MFKSAGRAEFGSQLSRAAFFRALTLAIGGRGLKPMLAGAPPARGHRVLWPRQAHANPPELKARGRHTTSRDQNNMGILVTIPLFALGETAVVVGGAAAIAGTAAVIVAKGHTNNQRPSSRGKHEAGDARRRRDQERAAQNPHNKGNRR